MSDELFIYAIVVLNVMVQLLLIARLKFPPRSAGKWKYGLLAAAVPLIVVGAMRLLIKSGAMPAAVAEQSAAQHVVTLAASLVIVVGPWAVTLAAILDKKRRAALGLDRTTSSP